MEAKKKRLTLDLDLAFQQRLKAIAARKGVSMRQYCQTAIEREMAKDEAEGADGSESRKPDHEMFAEARQRVFGDRILPGNSVDHIREAREIKAAQLKYS